MALMEQINDLKAQRRALVDQARGLLDTAEAANRDLTAEESQQYDRINADIDTMGARAERLEAQLERETRFATPESAPTRPSVEDGGARAASPFGSAEYRDAFWAYTRRTLSGLLPQEHRAMSVGSAADGGYLVPDEFHTTLVEKRRDRNLMRQLGNVIETSSGDHLIPVAVNDIEAKWTAEATANVETSPTFTQVALGAHKLAAIVKVSEEILNDSAFNLAAYIANQFAVSFGDAEEKAFVNGGGTDFTESTYLGHQPRGVTKDAITGVTAASSSAITTDEVLAHYHKLPAPYRANAAWLMNDNTALALRKLKASFTSTIDDGGSPATTVSVVNSGDYLWQPGLQAGQPDMLFGRPVYVSRYMPDIGAGTKPIVFGDYSYYWIADRQRIAMQRLVELYAASGQVGFRMFTRVDGRLVLPDAARAFVMHA